MADLGEDRRQHTADVVLYWMGRRGMTRQIFADRMGKSLSWVDKIRAGDRQLDRLSVLQQIARVLDIPLAVLIDPEDAEHRRVCPDDREIDAVRQALRRYDAITNVFRPNGDLLPEPDLPKLERTVRYGWMAFQATHYQVIGRLLADLIRDAQAAVWQLTGDERRQAETCLAWADMHSGGRVVEAAADIPPDDLVRLPRERQASHLLDLARGHLQAGHRDAATTLLDADQLAREEVRCRALTRQLLTDLVRSYPPGVGPLPALTQLARAVGVTG